MELVQRARNIVLSPKAEWQVIAPEATSVGALYAGYIAPLAAIGAIASFIGLSLVGVSLPFFGTYREPVLSGMSIALVTFVFALAGVFILALIIDALAPTFGGERNRMQALKVAAYAYTPAWLAGALQILPALGLLVLLASLYSLYLLYLGLPVLMRAPKQKAFGYTVVVVICALVLGILFAILSAALGGAGLRGTPRIESSLPAPAHGALTQLEKMASKMEAASQKMEAAQKSGDAPAQMAAATEVLGALLSGGASVEPIDPEQLKRMLPAEVAGLGRMGVEAGKAGMGGVKVVKAEASYGDDKGRAVNLTISDVGGMGAIAMLAGWALVEHEKETRDGYEKAGKVNGRPTLEKFSKSGQLGEYSVLIGNRFLVEGNSHQLDMDTLKKAVAAIDLRRLEAMKEVGVKK
ncbi:MAG TPA: Yip1 family protein [Burkholderiaceae bacterium]|nr:Yip1 family protein [Burkholderiaceae bacterium]